MLGFLGLRGKAEQLYTSVPASEADEGIAALAKQLKDLPYLTRLYLKEHKALYGDKKIKPSSRRPKTWDTVRPQ